MMAFMRDQVLRSVKNMSQQDLDFLLDAKANTIGALLVHLAAIESFFQMNTFEGKSGDKLPEAFKENGACRWSWVNPPAKASKATISTTT